MDTTVVIAIIVGPILAIQVQKLIEWSTQRKNAKKAIFKTLMSTRGIRLSPYHVQALNMIDLEFHGRRKKNKKVIAAWRLYLDQLFACPQDSQAADYKVKLDAWTIKSDDVLNDMLFEMAAALGYRFDKVLLKRGAYTPIGYGETEFDQYIIRKGTANLFLGLKSLPVSIVEAPPIKEKENTQEKLPNNPPTS